MCNNNGVGDCKEFLEVRQQNVWEFIFCDEAKKSKNRNRMGGKTLYDSVREASVTGISLVEICNKLLFAIFFNNPLTFNDALTCIAVFSFNCCESVVL